MTARGFTPDEWTRINQLDPDDFGLPVRKNQTFVLGTFNLLKLGNDADDKKRWDFLSAICERFDFLAVQEVMDNLNGLRRLVRGLPSTYSVLVSDTTGQLPGDPGGHAERLAFLYRNDRVRLDQLASDITYDRTKVLRTLYENRTKWEAFFQRYDERVTKAEQEGRKKPSLSNYAHPAFLTFIRQPHCAAFTILDQNGDDLIPFLGVNAHLLWGKGKSERKREFEALLDWLIYRTKHWTRMVAYNMVLLGDLNLEFELASVKREEIDVRLRLLNEDFLTGSHAGSVNFPLLFVKPGQTMLYRTNARQNQTYDQIGFFIDGYEAYLPKQDDNLFAGELGSDGYDYGVFNFAEMFSEAVFDKPYSELTDDQQDEIFAKCKADVSDHMPAWVRIPIP